MPPKLPVTLVDIDGKLVGNIVQLVGLPTEDDPAPIFNFEKDAITGVIDVLHHEGEMFCFSDSASVLNGASRDYRLTVGAGGSHFSAQISASGSIQIYLYEAPTISVGTLVDSFNMKRSDTTHVSSLTIRHTPTVGATGTVDLINGFLIPGGSSNQTRVGGGARPAVEWILKPNTEYLLRATNVSGATAIISVIGEYYEA
jgi:hypothetical protein